jgi:transcriptional regulator with XRE-family HTH domain
MPLFDGRKLRAMRCAAGLRVEELAARSGLSLSTVNNLEAGRNENPSARTLQRLCVALDRPAQYFFADDSQKTESEAV